MANVADKEDEVGAHTQHMRAAYAELTAAYDEHQQLKRDYAKALQEIETLRADLQRLQAGQGIEVIIDGKHFPLTAFVTLNDDFLNDVQPKQRNKTRVLEDSFMLSKD